MSDSYVQQQLCKKLDEFGTLKMAKNTLYRQMWNWEGESRWTLLYNLYDVLQQAVEFVNSVMPTDPLRIDSLPARYMQEEKYKKRQEEQTTQLQVLQQKEETAKKAKKRHAVVPPTAPEASRATNSNNSSSGGNSGSSAIVVAQEAILVAKNVDRVLSMRSLHESLSNVKIAIAQLCNKSRYKRDDELIALLLSLLNTTTRTSQRIEAFLTELKAM
jgi:hypothetical protein